MTALRYGLIGFGAMGRNHARVIQNLEGVQLAGIADPKVELDALPDGTPMVADVEQLLTLRLDACVVAAPTSDHEWLGLMLADAGVHALIEKPLASSSASAEILREVFEARGLVGAVGHIERYNPAIQSLWHHLAAGTLGRLYQLSTRRVGPFPERIRDVGVVLDLATHDVDLTMWLCGSEYASIDARTARRDGSEHEDLVSATGNLYDGTITNHSVNWVSPLKERLVTVTGSEGALIADTLTADLTYHANGTIPINWDPLAQLRGATEGEVVRFAIRKSEPLAIEHRAFRDAILGDEDWTVPMSEGARAISVAEEILAAAARGGKPVARRAATSQGGIEEGG